MEMESQMFEFCCHGCIYVVNIPCACCFLNVNTRNIPLVEVLKAGKVWIFFWRVGNKFELFAIGAKIGLCVLKIVAISFRLGDHD